MTCVDVHTCAPSFMSPQHLQAHNPSGAGARAGRETGGRGERTDTQRDCPSRHPQRLCSSVRALALCVCVGGGRWVCSHEGYWWREGVVPVTASSPRLAGTTPPHLCTDFTSRHPPSLPSTPLFDSVPALPPHPSTPIAASHFGRVSCMANPLRRVTSLNITWPVP